MRITELHIYPVKSCQGISVSSVRLDRRGPKGDRRFMLVNEAGGFLCQRQEPRLAWVETALDGDQLVLSTDHERVTVPQAPTEGPPARVRVWESDVDAIEVDEGSRFFSALLERQARLVYMPDETKRQVNPERGRPGDIVSFADGYPLLLISQESLDGLNERLAEPLPMTRFRPNVVVAGGVAHGEDALKSFGMGDVTFRNVKPCERCSMTSVDPATATYQKEPLQTLATYRKSAGQVWFGTNLIHDGEGMLSVGDPLTPL